MSDTTPESRFDVWNRVLQETDINDPCVTRHKLWIMLTEMLLDIDELEDELRKTKTTNS